LSSLPTEPKTLDCAAIRADFPVFEQQFHGKPLAYLDSATRRRSRAKSSTRCGDFYAHFVCERAPRRLRTRQKRAPRAGFEGARERGTRADNAPSSREVIFTRNSHRGPQTSSRIRGASPTLALATFSSPPSSSTTRTFVPWQQIAKRPVPNSVPFRSIIGASLVPRVARRTREGRRRQARHGELGVEHTGARSTPSSG